MRRGTVLILAGVSLGGALVACLIVRGLGEGDSPLEVVGRDPVAAGQIERQVDAEHVIVGGIRRRQSEVAGESEQPSDIDSDGGDEDFGRTGFGVIPAVAIDANRQTAAVGRILRERKDLDRLSALGRVASFDHEVYKKDSRAYLDSPEPGRAWAPAQPGEGVRQIASLSPSYQSIDQGDSAVLSVAGELGMPVTFTSLDAGEFQNKLSTITVETNEQGIARATYWATPGVIYEVRILAASPLMAGQSRWTVQVQPPNEGE